MKETVSRSEVVMKVTMHGGAICGSVGRSHAEARELGGSRCGNIGWI